jgi:outer membrane receptor protein involved in Fe transport
MNLIGRLLFCAFFLILFVAQTLALAPTGTLAGRITDPNDAPVRGAWVEVTNLATNAVTTVQTNGEGRFVVPELAPGSYRVRVSQQGFQAAVRENVTLTVAAATTANFALQVGDVNETVTVESSAAELVERDGGTVGTLVNRQFIENLPLNGRSFQTLIELTPGVVTAPASASNTGQFSVNGQRTNANYFTVDGVSANVGTSTNAQFFQQAAGTLPGLSVLGGTTSLASVDVVQEFRVQTSSYEAEFGRQPGGQISLVTRSGTNDLNFSLFEYFRNEKLDANDWFDNKNGIGRRALRQNDFGGTIGGPVFLPRFGEGTPALYDGRNRTFFFVSHEALILRQPQVNPLAASVPSLAARNSAPEPFRRVLNAFPQPNAPRQAGDAADTERYIAALSYPSRVDATSFRLDHRINSKINLFGRYSNSPSSQRFRSFPSQENRFERNIQTLTVGWAQILSSRATNDLRVNFSRSRGLFQFAGVEVDGAVLPPDSLLFPSFAPRETSAVSIILGTGNFNQNLGSANLTQGNALGTKQRQLNIVNTFTLIAGNHQLRFGVDYRRLEPRIDTRSIGISYNFNTPASRASGVPASIQVQAFAPITDFYVDNFSAFAQDTWRINPRLTLNVGLRWELNPPLQGDRLPFQIQGLDNLLTAALAPAGTKQWKTRYDNFAPRFGAAWVLSEKQNLVMRGGVGLFYDLGTGTALRGYSSFPYNTTRTITNAAQLRFPANEIDLTPPPFLDASNPPYSAQFFFFDPNLKLPRTWQWNFSVEKGFGGNQTVSVSYVGSKSEKLLRSEQIQNFNRGFAAVRFNGCPDVSITNPAAVACRAAAQPLILINPAIFGPTAASINNPEQITSGSAVNITRNGAESDYHALQAQYQRRLSKGLQALVSYTFGKALDDVSDETITGIPANNVNVALERGPANFDVRHNLVAALSYNVPKINSNSFIKAVVNGWSVDTIIRARTALPFSVITQAFDPLNIGTTRRVNIGGDVPIWLEDPIVPGERRLNAAAFSLPATGQQGSLGRNSLRGFPAHQLDLAVRREFNLTEKLRLQFRGEAFNLFNTPNFGTPAASFGTPNFGIVQSMLNRSLSDVTLSSTQTSPSNGFNPLYQSGGARSLQFAFKILY